MFSLDPEKCRAPTCRAVSAPALCAALRSHRKDARRACPEHLLYEGTKLRVGKALIPVTELVSRRRGVAKRHQFFALRDFRWVLNRQYGHRLGNLSKQQRSLCVKTWSHGSFGCSSIRVPSEAVGLFYYQSGKARCAASECARSPALLDFL